MGDVHMILMASYLQMPILLTEDSDIEMLRDIAKRRMRLGQYSLQILNGIQLIEEIAKKQDASISIKEIESILKSHEKTRCNIKYKKSMERKSYCLKGDKQAI